MVGILTNIGISFAAGLFAPIGAVCVLPLYPGFLSYLASKISTSDSKKTIALLGVMVTAGVVLSMLFVGLIFSTFLKASLTKAIGIVSPIAFGILAVISILLLFNFDLGRFFPQKHAPVLQNPYLSSLLFGIFFGIIVLPCNPASLAVLFAVSTTTMDVLTNFLNFLFFGIGMGLPLLIFSFISAGASKTIIGFLTQRKRIINIIAGLIMLVISLYYLLFVFRIFS
ncbi:cytochrome C biogenesis protein [Candidatus Woesearchaeota archaeon]|jgi:cytochrome c-type biogenesis protein|nr:cytochrome C biogenesis protein [Candidatus Woesearchaeota archaeon]MBT5397043.1 cytochrome C biogenesis protein [Candidatus Woesearchaeota archaeon]MBT6367411.1 cytochrome C biogenesis protein [Candidatus Woesearchaeota archaeon]MBT7762443.1 cytochrome C biogenesis protein [Candidatus Woesearchaeota archaeon]